MSGYTSSDLPNWLAQQRVKNAIEGLGTDNPLDPAYLTPPPPAANRRVGAERLNETYAGPPSSSFSPVIGAYGAHSVTAAMRANALKIASAAAQFGPADMASIRAFHGSPYEFHAFDTSKIGTGEGAQAYGHGLYFAEREGVARDYRDRLSDPRFIFPNEQAEQLHAELPYLHQLKYLKDAENGKDPTEWLSNLADGAQRHAEYVQAGGKPSVDYGPDGGFALASTAKQLAEQPPPKLQSAGRMYEVNIAADPEHFLDWDKPLSEQHDRVVQAVADLAAKKGVPMGNAIGARAYEDLANPPYGTRGHGVNDPAAVSEALLRAGIPGIRYLDQGSRAKGQGTYNYVIFDPATIEILRKYGIAGLTAGGAAAVTNNNQ